MAMQMFGRDALRLASLYCEELFGALLLNAQVHAPNPTQDMRHFKAMLRKVDNTFVKDLALKPEDLEALQSGTA